MPIPQQRDLSAARHALREWLAGQLRDAHDLRISKISGPGFTGFSSETLLFDATWQEGSRRSERTESFVVRVEPSGHTLFPDTMFEQQWQVMHALCEHTDVPVPRMRWFEQDRAVLGARFIVMNKVAGQAPSDNPPYPLEGWLFDSRPEEQAAVWWDGVRAMGAVHNVDWRSTGLALEAPDEPYLRGLDAQLAYYEHYLQDAAQGRPQPELEAGLRWLRRHQPAGDDRELCWGDARLGNILFDRARATAVLDWEMVCLGDPQQDLAWFIYFDRHHSENLGFPRLPGFPSYADTISTWQDLTGRSADLVDYYTVFAGVRFGVIMLRLAQIMVGFDILPIGSDFERNNTAVQFLEKLLADFS